MCAAGILLLRSDELVKKQTQGFYGALARGRVQARGHQHPVDFSVSHFPVLSFLCRAPRSMPC